MYQIKFQHNGKTRLVWGFQLHAVSEILKAMVDEGLVPVLIWKDRAPSVNCVGL